MAPRGKKILGLSMLSEHDPFHLALRAGLERHAQAAGFDLVARAAEFSGAEQAAQVQDFASRERVDAILLTPCDSTGVGGCIELANRVGVPVFTLDVARSGVRGKVVSHIASDNVQGGRLAAELMVRALGGRGTVTVATHPGVTSVEDRVRGFREVVAGQRGIAMAGELPAWSEPRRTCAEAVSGLLAHASLAGLFCVNDELAMGAIEAVEAAGRTGRVVVIGFNGTDEAREEIRRGRLHADVVQDPEAIGRLAVSAVVDHLAGKLVPPVLLAPVQTIGGEGRGGAAGAA